MVGPVLDGRSAEPAMGGPIPLPRGGEGWLYWEIRSRPMEPAMLAKAADRPLESMS